GRRARLRALWGQPRGGSSPLQRTRPRGNRWFPREASHGGNQVFPVGPFFWLLQGSSARALRQERGLASARGRVVCPGELTTSGGVSTLVANTRSTYPAKGDDPSWS